MPTEPHLFPRRLPALLRARGAADGARRLRADERGATGREHAAAETREGRLRIFDDVWETVRALYYDPHLRGLDWEGLRAKVPPRGRERRRPDELYGRAPAPAGAPLRPAHARLRAGRGRTGRDETFASASTPRSFVRKPSSRAWSATRRRARGRARGRHHPQLDGDPVANSSRAEARGTLGPGANGATHRERGAAGARARAWRVFDGPRVRPSRPSFRDEGGRERVVRDARTRRAHARAERQAPVRLRRRRFTSSRRRSPPGWRAPSGTS